MAAQQWAAIEKTNPSITHDMRRGDFSSLNKWRHGNIWSKASTLSTPELMQKATGEPLNARYFTEHLQRRYL